MSESADQKRDRRRWLNLAELVAIAGLIIAGLGFWLNYSERRDAAVEKASESKAKAVLLFEGTPADGGRTVKLTDANHKVQSIAVRFPAAFGGGVHEALAEPRIKAEWIAKPLLKLTDGGEDDREGRVPVLVTADWWDADAHRSDRAIYDLVWRTKGRFMAGRAVMLEGVALRERGGTPARLEAIWAKEKPAG